MKRIATKNLTAKPIAIIDKQLWEVVRRRAMGNRRIASTMNPRNRISMPVVNTPHHRPIDWSKFSSKTHVLTHCSILASCNVEADGHTVTENSSKYINENANGWQNQVLLESYRTFIGAASYREHVQVPALRKGDVIDAVLREVHDGKEKIYYCDLLIGTERRHADMVEDIESGKLNSLSMGTLANRTQCSRCGKVISDNKENCVHMNTQLLHPYVDGKGVRRITAELCGVPGDPNSNSFVEASWVYHPAFKGAVVNYFVTPQKLRVASSRSKMLKFEIRNKERFVAFLNESDERMRVASRMANVGVLVNSEAIRIRDIAGRIAK